MIEWLLLVFGFVRLACNGYLTAFGTFRLHSDECVEFKCCADKVSAVGIGQGSNQAVAKRTAWLMAALQALSKGAATWKSQPEHPEVVQALLASLK